MIEELQRIQRLAQVIIDESRERTPDREAIVDLLHACTMIDNYYKEFCAETDDLTGDEPGHAYYNGISVEFQIEADWWHEVSLALRKLRD